MNTSGIAITALGSGLWRVSATVGYKGGTKTGEATIRSDASPAPAAPPHAGLALSLAWRGLGEDFLKAGAAQDAAACFRQGLIALGQRYARLDVADDTDQKIAAAEELIEQGRLGDGAALLGRMLATRQTLYRDRYAGELK